MNPNDNWQAEYWMWAGAALIFVIIVNLFWLRSKNKRKTKEISQWCADVRSAKDANNTKKLAQLRLTPDRADDWESFVSKSRALQIELLAAASYTERAFRAEIVETQKQDDLKNVDTAWFDLSRLDSQTDAYFYALIELLIMDYAKEYFDEKEHSHSDLKDEAKVLAVRRFEQILDEVRKDPEKFDELRLIFAWYVEFCSKAEVLNTRVHSGQWNILTAELIEVPTLQQFMDLESQYESRSVAAEAAKAINRRDPVKAKELLALYNKDSYCGTSWDEQIGMRFRDSLLLIAYR